MTPVHPDTLQALSTGIQAEVASYVFYIEAAKKAANDEQRDTLHKLALEEKDHFLLGWSSNILKDSLVDVIAFHRFS